MNNNHNHTEDVLVNALAGTVPQARPEFQQALEEQLALTLQEQLEMKPMSINDRDTKPKRIPRGLSVSLAATIAMILFGGLAALVASGSLATAPMFTGAAQQQQADTIPQDFAATATAIILQATYQAAEAQFLTANAQLQALELQATQQAAASNPDQAMTSVVQTATAVVQQATERANADLFVTPSTQIMPTVPQVPDDAAIALTATALQLLYIAPTATPIGNASADVVLQTCPPEKLVVYTAPGTHNPVLTSIDPLNTEKYQIQGILTLNETGEDWFFVIFAYEGEQVEGWVQADTVRAACQNRTSSVIVGETAITLLPPTVVPPANTDALFPATCAPDSIAYYVEPGEDTAVAGSIDRASIIEYRIEASVMIDNTANEWILVEFGLADGQTVRGWVRSLELSPACHPTAVASTAMIATPVPFVDAGASPICPAQQLLLYAEPSRSANVVGDLPFGASLHIEGLLTLNMGDSWLLVVLEGVRGWLPAQMLPPECIEILAPEGVPLLDKTSVELIPLDASPAVTIPPLFTPTPTAWDAPAMLTSTPTPASLLPSTGIAPGVEQMEDGSYQITLPIAEEPVAEIEPDDLVYVLAEMHYGVDGRAWTVVAQDMQVIALLEPSPNAANGFRWMDVVLSSSDEETMSLLQDMAASGVAFSLERIP
jgi:hypothetical protein